jgi:mRNA interferase HigB
MNVISRPRIKEFTGRHPKSDSSLTAWYRIVKKEHFKNFNEIRKVFPSADQVENFVVFNIGGNNYRLIALVDYDKDVLFIRHILIHAEYDKEKWKKDKWYR